MKGHQRRARTPIQGKEGKRIHGGLGTGLHTVRWLSLQLQINGEDAVHAGKEAVLHGVKNTGTRRLGLESQFGRLLMRLWTNH